MLVSFFSYLGYILGIYGAYEIVNKIHKKLKDKHTLKKIVKGLSEVGIKIEEPSIWSLGFLKIRVTNWEEINDSNDKGWSSDNVKFKIGSKILQKKEELDKYIENKWSYEENLKVNKILFNDLRCGLSNFEIQEDKREGVSQLVLEFYQTDYKRFVGTNKNLSELSKLPEMKKYYNPRLFLKDGFKYLKDSYLSNDLATATTVVTNDNIVVLKKRKEIVYVLPEQIHTSIAEGMIWGKDMTDECPDPFKTIIRGAKEELNIDIRPENITILAFGVYWDFAQPFIACNVNIDMNYKRLEDCFNQIPENKREDAVLFPLDFTVPAITPHLFDLQREMGELAKISIILTLIKKYGRNKVEKDLNYIKKLLDEKKDLQME